MATYANLIADALLDLGVLAEGETVGSNEQASALRTLNRMLDSWDAEKLRLYTVARTEVTIVSGTATYTVGSGGNFNVGRPVSDDQIVALNYQDTSGTYDNETPLAKHTEESWARLTQKDTQATYPSSYYFDFNFASGLGTITLYPVPTGSTLELVLYAWTHLSQVTNVSSTVTLPPSYERAIVKNLAVELAPSYGKQVDPLLMQQATNATEIMKRANNRVRDLRFEPAALVGGWGRRYNVYTDGV